MNLPVLRLQEEYCTPATALTRAHAQANKQWEGAYAELVAAREHENRAVTVPNFVGGLASGGANDI